MQYLKNNNVILDNLVSKIKSTCEKVNILELKDFNDFFNCYVFDFDVNTLNLENEQSLLLANSRHGFLSIKIGVDKNLKIHKKLTINLDKHNDIIFNNLNDLDNFQKEIKDLYKCLEVELNKIEKNINSFINNLSEVEKNRLINDLE